LFVSNSQVIGCEDRLRNDLYCVGWGVKLCSVPSNIAILWLCSVYFLSLILKCQPCMCHSVYQVQSNSEDWKSTQLFGICSAATFWVSRWNGRLLSEVFRCRSSYFILINVSENFEDYGDLQW